MCGSKKNEMRDKGSGRVRVRFIRHGDVHDEIIHSAEAWRKHRTGLTHYKHITRRLGKLMYAFAWFCFAEWKSLEAVKFLNPLNNVKKLHHLSESTFVCGIISMKNTPYVKFDCCYTTILVIQQSTEKDWVAWHITFWFLVLIQPDLSYRVYFYPHFHLFWW